MIRDLITGAVALWAFGVIVIGVLSIRKYRRRREVFRRWGLR